MVMITTERMSTTIEYPLQPKIINVEDLEQWKTYKDMIISIEETRKKILNSETVKKKAEVIIQTYNSLSLLSEKDETFKEWFEQYRAIVKQIHTLYRDAIDEDSYVSFMSEDRIKKILEGKHEKILQQLLYIFLELTKDEGDYMGSPYSEEEKGQ